jgi:cation diffusion facilitator CzcD-associated flavoprotein CzcO
MGQEKRIAIIGTGFAGLGMAIRLKQDGVDDFVVLEKADDVGGTWRENTYPGVQCDVPSHLYSFSFAPNPGWSRTYSRQPEIRDYLERVVDDFGVREKIRLGCEVKTARWDGEAWDIETSAGPLRARVLVSATGPLVEPKIPPFPGLDRFAGPAFHSARWDHSVDLAGKRVAAVGTGASAIQFVPAIAPKVARLHVFQRTPPWVMPHSSRPITRTEKRIYAKLPLAQRLVRGGIYAGRELLVLGFVKQPRIMRGIEKIAERHMRGAIDDPALLAKVRPGYTIGCKRILPSNEWYPALARDNVELVTDPIAEVRERSIVTESGAEREVDAIVFGTGFHVVDMPVARMVRGRDGRTLEEAWQGSPRAHLGTTVAGFPNLFILLGPNTGLGHSSMVYMIESQIAYVMDALRELRRNGHRTVEVRPDVQERYNRDVQRRMKRTVWSTGCKSWYLDEQGNNPTLWPDWTWRFRRRTSRFDPAEYLLRA